MSAGDALEFYGTTELRSPTLVLAYAGWSDAGDAATAVVRHLIEQLSTERLASIDTEEFFDFTVVRPHVRQAPDGQREIQWPTHDFQSARFEEPRSDLILGLGIEPHLRWKAYTRTICELVRRAGVVKVVVLGAFLADVIYSQPIRVSVYSSDPETSRALGFSQPSYEGPTGIVGVLTDALRREGIPTLSLWASLPHYVSLTPNSRGALALLNRLAALTEIPCDSSSLERAAADFDAKVSEFIASDPQLTAYVRELKKRAFSQ